MADRRLKFVCCLVMLMLASIMLASCNEDTEIIENDTGDLAVDCTPDDIGISWQVTGPDGYMAAGSEDTILTDLAPGHYVAKWTEMDGWASPDSTEGDLEIGDNLIFSAVYGAISWGTIRVETVPAALNIPWQLTRPDGYLAIGTGDSLFSDMAAGNYELSWGSIDNWISPPDTSSTLTPGDTLSFQAHYRERWPFAGTPDQLLQNFTTIYKTMDTEGYKNLLSPDFLMILKSSTTAEFPEVGSTLDYAEEVRIAGHMFSGAAGHDAAGNLENPISSIAFQDPVQLTTWETTAPSDPIPNAMSALFGVMGEFNRAGATMLKVTGQLKFYITSRDSLYLGDLRTYYQMVGQEDFTQDSKSIENTAFGAVKALWR